MIPTVCVYKLSIGDYFYFGSSIEYPVRQRVHLYRLRKGIHANKFMQGVFNKYKELRFEVMQVCDQNEIVALEQMFIDEHFGNAKCMNLAPSSENNRGWKHTEQSKKLLSIAGKGRKLSDAGKEACRQGSAKITWDDVDNIRSMYASGNYKQKDLAALFGIDQTNVSLIVTNKHWVRA